jgi:hypothetical protein
MQRCRRTLSQGVDELGKESLQSASSLARATVFNQGCIVTTRKHIDRNTQGSAQRDLHAFACAAGFAVGGIAMSGYSRLDRSEPMPTPGKGSA